MSLDRDTHDTVAKMVRYVPSDRAIASYVRCQPEQVATVRRHALRGERVVRLDSYIPPRESNGIWQEHVARDKARIGSTLLIRAINAMRPEDRA